MNSATSYEFKQSIPAEAGYDLVVAGGGPAGTAAAVCAARLGLKVLLVEATGCLGGMGTSGMVASFGPVSDGQRMLVGGFMKELLETMWAQGAFAPQVVPEFLNAQHNRWVPFKPEHLKRILDDFVVAAGVEVRFFTRVVQADLSGRRINGVVLSNVEGLVVTRGDAMGWGRQVCLFQNEAESSPIFGQVDRFGTRSDDGNTSVFKPLCQTERCLTAKLHDDTSDGPRR